MTVPEELPALAMSRPREAVACAHQVLDDPSAGDVAATYAYQALAIVDRDSGRVDSATSNLRVARRLAVRAGADDRVVDLSATLGVALAFAGRRRDALREFDRALAMSSGVARGRVLVRRGAVHWMLGDPVAAVADLTTARRALATDTLWLARTLLNRGLAQLDLGHVTHALKDYRECRDLYADLGQDYEVATVLQNEGDALSRAGRLPEALGRYEQAEQAYSALGVELPELAMDRAAALLTAGLALEALAVAEHAVDLLDQGRQARARLAGALLLASDAAMAAADVGRARRLATRAEAAARSSGNPRAALRARLLGLRARTSQAAASPQLLSRLVDTAQHLDALGLPESLDAQILVGRVAEALDRHDLARDAYRSGASARRNGPALRRAASWLAAAHLARLDGDRRKALRACKAGLDVLDTHRLSLGSTELRAAATWHGRDLAATAVRQVLAHGSGRDLLRWSERWRATLLDTPPAATAHGAAEIRDLTALRAATVRVLDPASDPAEAAALERERVRLEARIRRRAHSRAGERAVGISGTSVDEIVRALRDDTALVTITRVDGVAHVVVARQNRVHRYQAGGSDDIDRGSEFARFALRSAATGDEATAATMTSALEGQADRLQELLLGDAVRTLGDGPVVVVPPARLQSIPWDALPAFRHRPISVSPSASAWLRSCRATRPRQHRVALVTGPRLESAGAEVPELARAYAQATVLGDGAATCDATMKALDGAWLAHVAAHGTIRTDNPMFSALELDDGPLTIYDLERLRRAPYRLVLSVCESAVGAPTGADELLGLSSALIGLGTAGLLASIVPVNDEATVPFSLTIHERLRAGDDLATALMHARQAAGDDPVARATAYSFLALGAA